MSSVSSGEGENLQAKTVKEILYSACLCDRGTYTQPKEKCDKTQNLCKDSSGAEYTDTCVCDKGKYKVQVADCDYGGEGKTCVEGGVTFAEDCCSCEAYPVELRDGKAVSGGEIMIRQQIGIRARVRPVKTGYLLPSVKKAGSRLRRVTVVNVSPARTR